VLPKSSVIFTQLISLYFQCDFHSIDSTFVWRSLNQSINPPFSLVLPKVGSLTSYLVCLRTTNYEGKFGSLNFWESCVKCLYTCPLPVVPFFLWKNKEPHICSSPLPLHHSNLTTRGTTYLPKHTYPMRLCMSLNIWQMVAPNLSNLLSVVEDFTSGCVLFVN
jgi:hypothetical protein